MPEYPETAADIERQLEAKRARLKQLLEGGLLNEFGSAETIEEGEELRREITELEERQK